MKHLVRADPRPGLCRGDVRLSPRSSVVAIRGGTILTVTRGTIQNGSRVRDGKIAAVGGSGTDIPPGADIVEAKGRFVSPGIIDAHSHIAADSINEGGTTVSSMTGIEDVLDPTDVVDLSRPGRRPDGRQRAARQRQSDRRQEPGDQAALGQERARADLRRRAAGHQVRARKPERHAQIRTDRAALAR